MHAHEICTGLDKVLSLELASARAALVATIATTVYVASGHTLVS